MERFAGLGGTSTIFGTDPLLILVVVSPTLVGGLEHFLFFHILGISSTQLTFIFFRGVGIPPTRSTVGSFPLEIYTRLRV
jgi:hypothetical protein